MLWFTWRDFRNPEAGGAEVFAYEVATRLAGRGHEVTLFTSEFEGCRDEELADGIRIIRKGTRYSVYREARECYRDRLSGEGFDTVIDEINTRPFLTPKFVNNGEKIFCLIHQLAREYWFYETPFPISSVGYYILEGRWLRNYADVSTITVSRSTAQDLLDLGFRSVSIVPEGVNFRPLDEVPEKEKYPVIAYVGRLKRAKRPDHAIKAFKLVKEKVPEAEMWMIGDGYFRPQLERMRIEGVRFFGSLPNPERREILKRAWVMVNPSVREGFGLNIIEANALGVPCAAYDVPGLRDSIRDGETGILARGGDVVALSQAILKILTDGSFRGELSHSALEYSRGFNWDRTADEFFRVITGDSPLAKAPNRLRRFNPTDVDILKNKSENNTLFD